MDLTATVQRLTKADFSHGLGIFLGTKDLSLVHVAKRFIQVSVHQVLSVALPEADPERTEVLRQTLVQFLRETGIIPDQVVVALSRQAASVSRLLVPETARESLTQVLEYEAERLLPFPREDIYYDYLTADAGGEEKRIAVMLFCLPRRTVDELLEVLGQVGLRPQMVTLSSSALLNTLAVSGRLPEVPCVLVAPENGACELNFVEKRQLVASHLFTHGHGRGDLDRALAQGVARNLPGADVEETPVFTYATGEAPPVDVDAEHDLYTLVRAQFPTGDEDGLFPAALPAVGAAFQAVGEGVGGVNLLPEDKRAKREKRLSPLTLALAGLVGILGVTWAVVGVVQERRALNSLKQQIAALEPTVRQVQVQEEEAGRLQKQLQVLDAAVQKRVAPVLKNLSETLPLEFYLNSFRYKDGDLELSGLGSKPASDLVALLENSQCLRGVAPKAPFTKTAQGETFTLGAQVEQCDD